MTNFGDRVRSSNKGRKHEYIGPLRKIVERFHEHVGTTDIGIEVNVPRERLECGHVVRPRSDIFGETNATRRRCRECGKTP